MQVSNVMFHCEEPGYEHPTPHMNSETDFEHATSTSYEYEFEKFTATNEFCNRLHRKMHEYVSICVQNGRTSLNTACQAGHLHIVEYLYERGGMELLMMTKGVSLLFTFVMCCARVGVGKGPWFAHVLRVRGR
jgi:hypothetical protein